MTGPLTLPVFGLEPSLCWVAPLKATGLPESVAVQEREHLPRSGRVLTLCAPRHKVKNSLSTPEEEEVEEEKKTIWSKRPQRKPSVSLAAYPSYALRTQVAPTAVGIPEKKRKLRGLSKTPFPHPCGSVSFDLPSLWDDRSNCQPCELFLKTTEAKKPREPHVKGCQISPTAQTVP